jgi:hypothetical protein
MKYEHTISPLKRQIYRANTVWFRLQAIAEKWYDFSVGRRMQFELQLLRPYISLIMTFHWLDY